MLKRGWLPVWGLLCLAVLIMGPGAARGQSAGSAVVPWGLNDVGQCDVPAPNADFVAVAAGFAHSMGLRSNGTIAAWGDNAYGRCVVPAPNADFVAVAVGRWHSVGLKSDGRIVVWGRNGSDQCNVPAPNADFVAVAAGRRHSLGLRADGRIVAWGGNTSGQCSVPAPNADFVAVAAGDYHSLGLKSDGRIVTWGRNDTEQCEVPAPNAGFVKVAGGALHSLGIKADGSIVAWGDNMYGQCRPPAPNLNYVLVSGGFGHNLALRQAPSAVALSSFRAAPAAQSILLSWSTWFESGNLGFWVLRATAGHDDYVRLNDDLISPPGPYTFLDTEVSPRTTYRYRLEAVDRSGGSEFFGPVEATVAAAPVLARFLLSQSRPNPFVARQGAAAIDFVLGERAHARLRVFDATGRAVRELVDELLSAGPHTAWWDGRDGTGEEAGSGTYFYRLDAGNASEVRALVKVR